MSIPSFIKSVSNKSKVASADPSSKTALIEHKRKSSDPAERKGSKSTTPSGPSDFKVSALAYVSTSSTFLISPASGEYALIQDKDKDKDKDKDRKSKSNTRPAPSDFRV
ncbi:hypothetical protein BGZ58_006568 [Dissophora ornata]|nr:hypothetical protein BGZ58_006568 [Dissophora ornata]